MKKIRPEDHRHILFFTGAGMSAESGVPTYRGAGGVWRSYRWEEYACQEAFDANPEKVLRFHELRRKSVLACQPHAGHETVTRLEGEHPQVTVVTQNIDGMHQRAGSRRVLELHGSLWRLRCPQHGIREDIGEAYRRYRCEDCGNWLRPDITWFGDMLDAFVMGQAVQAIRSCDLFVGIGTSGVVWPAAGFPQAARDGGARCIEINPEASEMSSVYHESIRGKAGDVLPALFAG